MTAYTFPRLAFAVAVSAVAAWNEDAPEPVVEIDGREMTVSALCGRFWRDTGLMPNSTTDALRDLARDLDLPPCRPTYAAGARLLRRAISVMETAPSA